MRPFVLADCLAESYFQRRELGILHFPAKVLRRRSSDRTVLKSKIRYNRLNLSKGNELQLYCRLVWRKVTILPLTDTSFITYEENIISKSVNSASFCDKEATSIERGSIEFASTSIGSSGSPPSVATGFAAGSPP